MAILYYTKIKEINREMARANPIKPYNYQVIMRADKEDQSIEDYRITKQYIIRREKLLSKN